MDARGCRGEVGFARAFAVSTREALVAAGCPYKEESESEREWEGESDLSGVGDTRVTLEPVSWGWE